MSRELVLTAAGFASPTGFGGSQTGWTAKPVPAGGPGALRWSAASDAPFDRFGRLDALSKCVLVAAEMCGLPPVAEGLGRPDMAVVLGTRWGSLAVDLEFLRSIGAPGGASPALFSYTLPSTAIAEAAIRYRLAGPNLCLLAGAESGLLALWEGLELVAGGEADGCLCLAGDALGEGEKGSGVFCRNGPSGCCAQKTPDPFSLEAVETARGCAYAFVVEERSAALRRSRPALAEARIRREAPPPPDGPAAGLGELYQFLAEGRAGALCLAAPAPAGAGGALIVERGP